MIVIWPLGSSPMKSGTKPGCIESQSTDVPVMPVHTTPMMSLEVPVIVAMSNPASRRGVDDSVKAR